MSSPAVHHARLSNHTAAVAISLARIGLDEAARWWRQEARRQRALSREIAAADHIEKEAA